MKKNQKTAPNKKVIRRKAKSYTTISNKLLFDFRLNEKESMTLIRLLAISDDFHISTNKTADFLKISKPTFLKYLKQYESLGYLKIKRESQNIVLYEFSDESSKIDFKPYLIDQYNIKQLNEYFNNQNTPTRYKNLIKKYFDSLSQDTTTFKETLNEIKKIDLPKIEIKADKQSEEMTEEEIIKYLYGE